MSANADYRIAWADRIQKHLFNGGVLTPESTAALWNARADEIRVPIIAESARWGDAHVSNPRTQATWQDQLNDLNTLWFPARTDILLEQLHDRDLFPDINAPEFSDRGGTVPAGFTLELSTDEIVSSVGTFLLREGHDVQALVPPDSSLDDLWFRPNFVPAATWKSGAAGVGYDNGATGLHEGFQLDVGDDWSTNRTSVYSRSDVQRRLGFDPRRDIRRIDAPDEIR